MTKKQRAALLACTKRCLSRSVTFKRKGSSERFNVGTVEDVVSVIDGEYNHLIQRIKLSPETARDWGVKRAYRVGYYTLAAKARRPVWGQYHSLILSPEFHQLARKAHKKGWLGLPKK